MQEYTNVIGEFGDRQALYGLGLSYCITSGLPFESFIEGNPEYEQMVGVAYKLRNKNNGENKFLESIQLWFEIRLPRFVWQEFSTYRVGISTQSECFSDDTKFLTDSGWKLYDDISNDDKLLTYNLDSKFLEYQKPTGRFENKNYVGDMVSIKSRSFDFIVTQNHNIVANGHRTGNSLLKEAKDISSSTQFVKTSRGMVSGDEPYMGNLIDKFHELDIKNWLAFFGIWLSDGYTTHSDGGSYITAVCQSESSKYYEEIDELMMSLPFIITKTIDKRGECKWISKDRDLYNYLSMFGKAADKYIPRWILQLDKEYLKILYNWMYIGDGRKLESRSTKEYFTISKRLAEEVQEINIKLGYFSTILTNYYTRGSSDELCEKYTVSRHSSTHGYVGCTGLIHDYSGRVVCFETPNHTLIVSRNGKMMISGNSTMHTITRGITQEDFYKGVIDVAAFKSLISFIETYKDQSNKTESLVIIKSILPEGFMQRRIVNMNYKALAHMYYQRKNHRLTLWNDFLLSARSQIEHPELIFSEGTNE